MDMNRNNKKMYTNGIDNGMYGDKATIQLIDMPIVPQCTQIKITIQWIKIDIIMQIMTE